MDENASTDEFEREFHSLLAEAHRLADDVYAATTEGVADRYLRTTVYRLLVGTVPLYEAALTALAQPRTSLGALALLRPVIENFLHLRFLVGDDEEMQGAPCRALRLELGWATETDLLVRSADPAQIPEMTARLAEVRRLLRERGCSEEPRSWRSTGASVRAVAEELSLDWLPGAWRSTSQAVHGSGWEWLLRSRGFEVEWTHPEPSERTGWLNNLLWAFNTFSQGAFVLLGQDLTSGVPRQLRQRAEQMLAHPLLSRPGGLASRTP